MKKVVLCKIGTEFFVGNYDIDKNKIEDCLVFTYHKVDGENGEPKIITSLTNPMPFQLETKEGGQMFRLTFRYDACDSIIDIVEEFKSEDATQIIQYYNEQLIADDSNFNNLKSENEDVDNAN